MPTAEFNFDGLVGPTHNYAGLAIGNLASQENRLAVSNPRAAALQGLAKMKFLADLGVGQAVFPPAERPDLSLLRRLGFAGTDSQVLASAPPSLLAAAGSAASMWAANAATVSPAADTRDGRTHFTPANLISQLHRSTEADLMQRLLPRIFPDENLFAHHPPLPGNSWFADEGAANHLRLAAHHSEAGVEIFVFGRSSLQAGLAKPLLHPARQTLEASQGVARLHGPGRVLFVQQNPAAIDAGVFHNDVAAVANETVLLYHASAFLDTQAIVETIGAGPFHLIAAAADELPIADAVMSYVFNSQLVTLPDGAMSLIAPIESRGIPTARAFIDRVLAGENPIRSVHYVDVHQSMRNGGGPACLRLRVVLTDAQQRATHPGVRLDPALYSKLTKWVNKHYRDRLEPGDLADPQLLQECRTALDELTALLGLGALYEFQRSPGR